jgi:hypothetical protein
MLSQVNFKKFNKLKPKKTTRNIRSEYTFTQVILYYMMDKKDSFLLQKVQKN